ncbi:hypothetical protein Kpol_2001p10 [Vanderwaltozyma polyspora DSM 70294]|uniref:Protein kinase domain-containing protein n=1 Tax=Vanderwaltozyma polyspora (strain ATCC 22028 / DSM 70294 / BCRC 21397 / CBS 2163 / NBRC 10782 / NRRL Y-8283 / UCD 57-17) TaxID=436907 RepID=A7TGP6_VANPO|nr:uncharacterized protein Kpol_2001p10 [Vanderwaltozyma polyspora DSM 70294]EDO18509.1 hypothetical protein Kpol_2001p10 [Vanderwaltozyma polyspora DSM 70294]
MKADSSSNTNDPNSDNENDKQNMWNPIFINQNPVRYMSQQQQQHQYQHLPQNLQHQQQQQLTQEYSNSQQMAFVNPWMAATDDSINYSPLYSTAPPSTLSVLQESDEHPQKIPCFDNYNYDQRRKSSIIIPPTREPAPNPYLQEYYNGYPAPVFQLETNEMMNQQQQYNPNYFICNQPLYQQSGDSTFSIADPTMSFSNQDLTMRQSVGPEHFISDHTNSNQYSKNGKSTQQLISYRRLSAFPQTNGFHTLQPPMYISSEYRKSSMSVSPKPLMISHLKQCHSKADLEPVMNQTPKFRRASLNSKTISPLIALTKGLITTYSLCSPSFSYKTCKNPKRVLTKPSDGKFNNGYDNINSDYILCVNDVLGTEQNRKYLVLDILGQGTFGQVVKCQNILTSEIVAIKVIKSRAEYINQSITEVKILKFLNQELDPYDKHHFLRLFDSFLHRNHLCLVFEVLGKNLYEVLKQNRFHGLTISLIRKISSQLLDCLCMLKDNKIVHCDLKPENILLTGSGKSEIKVIDFGSSCQESRTLFSYIQSRFYRSPEVIMGIPYSTSIDMWSLGCIIAELFLGIPIFPGSSEFNQLTRIISCIGNPPAWMIDMGKSSDKYFIKIESDEETECNKYRLKTIEEYNTEFQKKEIKSKLYFKWDNLSDIIENYRFSKELQKSPVAFEQEKKDRRALEHFLSGILSLNPLERWTPQQALMHPFITQQHFSGDWYPPGFIPHVGTSPSNQDFNDTIMNNNDSHFHRSNTLQDMSPTKRLG